MSLSASMKAFKADQHSNTDSGENPFNNLTHKTIKRLSKDEPQMYLRILPPENQDDPFFQAFRSWGIEIPDKNGNKRFTSVTLAAKADSNDPIQNLIDELQSKDLLPVSSRYHSTIYPATNYYVNVVPYVAVAGANGYGLQMMVDDKGLPDVYVANINSHLMSKIMSLVNDPMNNPNLNPTTLAQLNVTPTEEQKSWSFLSDGVAYVLDFRREVNNKRISTDVNLTTNFPLAPLPQGWQSKLEDLKALATPTYQSTPSWATYVINALRAQQLANVDPVQAPVRTNATATVWNNSMPTQDTPQPQAQPYTTTTTTFVPSQPVQQAPQPQAAPAQQPTQAQPTSPLANFGAPLQQSQPVQEAPQPQPGAQPAPQPQAAPVEPAPDVDMPDPSDMLKKMGIDPSNLI